MRLAVEAREALELAEVRLIPVNNPGHRATPQASAALRLEMLRAVLEPPLYADDCEIRRDGTSYTVKTLSEFRAARPTQPLCWLLGMDSYLTLPAWHQPEKLLELAHLVVVSRPGEQVKSSPELDDIVGNAHAHQVSELHEHPAGRVFFLPIPELPIAASELRNKVRKGEDISFLTAPAVIKIINANRLYQS